ncbi:MAG: bifunctional 23S rRNA (guanine(2069)-N(7))-methyltransferase RlmK/23S rRNA (guanine(2445)-N(2))-methyltransferase RlmL [Proteobacteria bacterium]|nr:bifunctional 23S rRNA (guanine(2069)-N(7))-methyltransferase RlmK/23S rRNA (guanine(2445)-N(2))-methyltransferase RlmL [Pseudomonadota bacterium]
MTSTLFPIHVRTSTGLETLLFNDLSALGLRELKTKHRLVTGVGTQKQLYKINLWSRTAIRVFKPLASFSAPTEKTFYDHIKAIDWSPWLSASGTLAIDSHVHSSFTTHSLYISQLAKDAICDQFREQSGKRPSVDLERPDLRLSINLFKNHVELFLDSSGDSLHKRGYRKKTGVAPLNESLAAGIIALSHWNGETPLLDPMTGSGTLAIEAALIATNTAPGLFRSRFGFQNWKDYDSVLFDTLVAEARNAVRPISSPKVFASDHDPRMITIASDNIARAGMEHVISLSQKDFFSIDSLPSSSGVVVMNPPYDERMEVRNIAEHYSQLGAHLKQRFGGWKSFILTSNLEAAKDVGLRAANKFPLNNGALECLLLEYEINSQQASPSSVKSPVEENPVWIEKATVFTNRLQKNYKHLNKWAKRDNVSCWRVYDRDIPEFPFIIDLFEDYLHFAEVPRNHEHTPLEHQRYLNLMTRMCAERLGFSEERTILKIRQSSKPPQEASAPAIEVRENGKKFLVNLIDYVDVGLFLEQREIRKFIGEQCKGKDFLNLFGFTGTASVYAALGGAHSTTTVDASITYLSWAEQNFKLNGLIKSKNHTSRSDVVEFLKTTDLQFDFCWVDPPVRFVNRQLGTDFNVQDNHVELITSVLNRMRNRGTVLFTTSARSFVFAESAIKNLGIQVLDMTPPLTPLDFSRSQPFQAWLLTRS